MYREKGSGSLRGGSMVDDHRQIVVPYQSLSMERNRRADAERERDEYKAAFGCMSILFLLSSVMAVIGWSL